MKIVLVLGVVVLLSCSETEIHPSEPLLENSEEHMSWSIPKEDILGPYTSFPVVTESSFVNVDDVDYRADHLTALISLGPNELRAYPHEYIGLYEIINNEFRDKKYAVTHCPLTGSTICFDRSLKDNLITLKASGYLFRDNVVPIDIETGSLWSQMLMRGVSGKYDYEFLDTYNLVETDWNTVKEFFPDAKVYNENIDNVIVADTVDSATTNRDYFRYGILSRPVKTQVHIFNYDLFEGGGLNLISTQITGRKVIVIGNKNYNLITSFFGKTNTDYFVDSPDTMNFKDDKGNTYNAMGLVIDGPDKDLQLESPKAYTAAWAAWQDLFDDFVVYE